MPDLYEVTQLEKLPVGVASLHEQYPILATNLGEVWGKAPIQEQPRFIEVYYDDSSPSITFKDGELQKFIPESSASTMVAIYGDDELIYCEAKGKEVLNRLGNLALPDSLVDPVAMVNASMGGQNA